MPRVASVLIILALLMLLTIPGCWDMEDIRNRAFVIAIGIDVSEKEEEHDFPGEKPPKYKVTFEIARPAGLRPQPDDPSSIVQTVEAASIDNAIEHLQARISRTIYLDHLRVLLVGEDIARENFNDIADFFQRHPQVQKRIRLMFVQGEAMNLLKMEPLFEQTASGELVAMARLDPQFSIVRFNPLINFLHDMRFANGKGLASRVFLSEDGKLAIRHGGAVFDDWRLVGWLSHKEVQAANWLLAPVYATIEGQLDNGIYTYFTDKNSFRIIPDTEGGDISFTVRVEADGTIRQQQGEILDLSDPENIDKLESLFSQTINQQVRSAISKAQRDFEVDYLGFGKALNRRAPQVFRAVDWEEEFPTVPINVEVQVKITRTGISP